MFVIAGATGRTGRAVAEALLARGVETRVLVRTEQARAQYQARGADARVAALEDAQTLSQALRGADALYALLPEELHNPTFREKRSAITASLVAAVRDAGVPRVVFLSARAAAISGANGQAADLHAAEKALGRVSKVTVLRASYFQENLVPALSMAQQTGLYLNFLPESEPISMVATRDVAQSAADALLHAPARSEVIDVLGPSYSPRQVADTLTTLLSGKRVRVVDVAPAHQVSALREAGLCQEGASALVQLLACLARPELLPAGDRTVKTGTPLAATLAGALRGEDRPTRERLAAARAEQLS